MAVLLDVHTCHVGRGGGEAESPVACTGYDLAAWHDDLKTLARLAAEHPHVLGIDLFNEPHALTWAEWSALASEASEVILRENPRILIFVEGVGNESHNGGFHAFWGENLTEALAIPVDAPPSRLVYSPHVYGPSVEEMDYFAEPGFPANMPPIWEVHFGAVHAAGHAVVPGELGSVYDEAKVPGSVVWQDALVAYFVSRGIRSFFYWSLNPTSGDTGGLLLDDWQTPNQAKLDSLAPLLQPPRQASLRP
jgi:endoglucanase